MREARPHCYRCDKPRSMCVCPHLRPLPNRTGVHVLQHPHERRHALNTVRLLRLGLEAVEVHVLGLRGASSACPPVPLPAGAGLLYPEDDARDLTTLAPDERPPHLVVIDGTWDQAHRLFRDNPWIQALPRYRLDPEHGSRYRIRAEPRAECLSTVESVVAALRALEPELAGTDMLDRAFDAMIDDQIAAAAKRPSNRPPREAPRGPRPQPLPAPLGDPAARIVVVYAEAEPRPADPAAERVPVRLSAVSLDDGRVFDRVVQVSRPPDAYLADRMGLEPGQLQTAAPLHEVLEAFHAFAAEGAAGPVVLSAWSAWTHRWLVSVADDAVTLKEVWANHSRAAVPGLEALVAELGLDVEALPVSGRAGRRLAHACTMARHLLREAGDG